MPESKMSKEQIKETDEKPVAEGDRDGGEVLISDGFFKWLWWKLIGWWLTEEAGKASMNVMDGEIARKKRRRKVASRAKNVDFQSIWENKQHREYQLLVIFILVMVTVALAYVIGYFKCSFGWLMLPLIILLSLWRYKIFRVIEDHLAQEHVQVHRKRALRGSETAEWMNFVMNRWTLFSSQGLSDLMKRKLNPLLIQFKPPILDHVAIKSFTLGEHAPFIKHIQVFEVSEGLPGGRKQASWLRVGDPPKEVNKMEKYQMVLDMEAGMHCENFKMVLQTKLLGLPSGPDILVENLRIQGRLQAVVTFSLDVAFPHVSKSCFSFIEKPNIWFSVKTLKSVQLMDIPLLKSWIHNFVMDAICLTLVDPYQYEVDLNVQSPTSGPSPIKVKKENARGVLTVTVKGEPCRKDSFSDEPEFFVLKVGSQSYSTDLTPQRTSWQDTCSFLIRDVGSEKLVLKVKAKKMLSNVTIASYDLKLGNYAFDENNNVEAVLDEKDADLDTKLTLSLEYSPLPPVVVDAIPPTQIDVPQTEVAGVVYLCIHGGVNLLALDRSGTSDPYCVVFANRKKVVSTHYVTETRNPKWDVTHELLVEDFSQTTFTFLCYDWDGNEACDDDFMGASHLMLSQDEPWAIHKSLTLTYNIMNVGAVTHDTDLGSIIVSAVFRPAESVKRSANSLICVDSSIGTLADEVFAQKGLQSPSSSRTKPRLVHQYSVQNRMSSSSGSDVHSPRRKSSHSHGADVFKMLSQGHTLLELRIIRARDLMAMDKNGFSDPYCVVKIGKEKKFQTNVKKKTLDPAWDEFVTTHMPEKDDKLEIVVWDKDPLMMKDFLGELTFTSEEIKRLSSIDEPVWFLLHKAKTGQIQLQFKVIVDDMKGCLNEIAHYAASVEEADKPNVLNGASDVPVHSISEEEELESQKPDRTRSSYTSLPSRSKKHKDHAVGRSHSDVQVNKAGKFRMNRSKTDSLHHNSDDTMDYSPKGSTSSLEKSSAVESRGIDAPSLEKFFDVRGQLVKLKIGDKAIGIGTSASFYCKIRLDSRSESQRALKFSPGRVLTKSQAIKAVNNVCLFKFSFEIDRGGGIPADTLMIFDFKSTHKNQHIATKGYTLGQLFEDMHQVSKWLYLENDIQIFLELQRSKTQVRPRSRGHFSMLSLGSKRKKKETTPLTSVSGSD